MEISINKNREAVIRKAHFVWNWYSRPYYIAVLYFLISGIVLLYLGFASDYTWKVIPVRGDSTIYNLHIGVVTGSALLIIAAIRLLSIQAGKKSFFYDIDLYIKPLSQNGTSIVVNDNSVIYSDALTRQEYKWIKFSGFVYKKGFLMLVRSKKVPTSFIIHEGECSSSEFRSIMDSVKTKLTQIK